MERRNAVRYQLQIPAVFRWINDAGVSREGRGVTRDISDFGTYVYSSTIPPLSAEVNIEITRAGESGAKRPLLTGRMKVMRVEDSQEGGLGFSLTGGAFRLYVESL